MTFFFIGLLSVTNYCRKKTGIVFLQPVVDTLRKDLFDQLVTQTAYLSLNHQCRIHNIILLTLHKCTMHSNNIFVNATTMIAIVFVVITKTLWTEVLRRLAPNSPPTHVCCRQQVPLLLMMRMLTVEEWSN